MTYQVGPTSGCALFDLRQSIDHAWLDGRPFPTASLRSRELGEGPYATMRVVEVPQAAHSTHTLRLRYRLASPHSDLGGAYPPVLSARGPRRLRWSFGMADLFDGRHLEMWFPSNLPFDQFPFDLVVTLTGEPTDHTLITNGTATTRGPHAWHIAFPPWFSSLSPMVELRPTDERDHVRTPVVLSPSRRAMLIDVWKVKGRPADLRYEAARIKDMLEVNESRFGAFPAERYTCFFHDAEGGMEYAGATTTSRSALAHEVLHSWFARGVMPATDADGWWDEAFTTWVTAGAPLAPLDFDRAPVKLCSRRPFQRHTVVAAYREGSRLFSGLAEMAGRPSILRSMGRLFRARQRTCVSTAELEQQLVLGTGAVTVVDAFHRFVYGFDDPRRRSGVRFDGLWLSDGLDGRSWITARVSNDRDAEVCQHFVVLFSVAAAGAGRTGSDAEVTEVTEVTEVPAMTAMPVAAIAGFDLGPGQARILRTSMPTHLLRPDARAADIVVVGGVHSRLAHPSGRAGDYRERTMTRTAVRRAGRPEPAPAVVTAG